MALGASRRALAPPEGAARGRKRTRGVRARALPPLFIRWRRARAPPSLAVARKHQRTFVKRSSLPKQVFSSSARALLSRLRCQPKALAPPCSPSSSRVKRSVPRAASPPKPGFETPSCSVAREPKRGRLAALRAPSCLGRAESFALSAHFFRRIKGRSHGLRPHNARSENMRKRQSD